MHEDLELEKKNNSKILNAGNISSFVKDKWYVICVRMKSWFLFIFCLFVICFLLLNLNQLNVFY